MAIDRPDIKSLGQLFGQFWRPVHYGDIVAFRRQVASDIRADLAGTADDYIHDRDVMPAGPARRHAGSRTL